MVKHHLTLLIDVINTLLEISYDELFQLHDNNVTLLQCLISRYVPGTLLFMNVLRNLKNNLLIVLETFVFLFPQ